MVTVLLIFVLCGGAGLLALALVERVPGAPQDATGDPSVRRGVGPATSASGPGPVSPTVPRAPIRGGAARLRVRLPPLPVIGPGESTPVPKGYVATEGRFDLVAAVPLWRKVLSVVAMLAIVVLLGVVVAAVLGAIIGTLAELLSSTIG